MREVHHLGRMETEVTPLLSELVMMYPLDSAVARLELLSGVSASCRGPSYAEMRDTKLDTVLFWRKGNVISSSHVIALDNCE